VGSEERANDAHRDASGDAADDAEVAKLFVEREAVARLAFDGGRTGRQSRSQASLDQALERLVIR
jgi:hypothetical protein